MLHCSELLFVGEPEPGGALISEWLSAFGWRCRFVRDPSALEKACTPDTKLLVVDAHDDGEMAAAIVRDIRGLCEITAGLPILLCGASHPHFAGANAVLPHPLTKDRALELIGNWTGPLADHDFRSPGNPRYRLVRMMGLAESERLFAMFVQSLKQGLADLQNGGDVRHVAHNVAGIAGMMGYADLNALWSAVSKGDVARVDDARRETIAFLRDVA
jgi:CheY-like chemotaxis protein